MNWFLIRCVYHCACLVARLTAAGTPYRVGIDFIRISINHPFTWLNLTVGKLRSSGTLFGECPPLTEVLFYPLLFTDQIGFVAHGAKMSSSDSTKAAILKLLDEQQRPFSLSDISEKVKELGKSTVQKWVKPDVVVEILFWIANIIERSSLFVYFGHVPVYSCRALDSLVRRGKIIEKVYGKQRIYCIAQEDEGPEVSLGRCTYWEGFIFIMKMYQILMPTFRIRKRVHLKTPQRD